MILQHINPPNSLHKNGPYTVPLEDPNPLHKTDIYHILKIYAIERERVIIIVYHIFFFFDTDNVTRERGLSLSCTIFFFNTDNVTRERVIIIVYHINFFSIQIM